jgi:xanthine dehydrogenase YagR molybdenum-binding subunit
MPREDALRGGHRSPQTTGPPVNRVDGKLKVTGAARYAADFTADDLVHGFVVSSAIASGRIIGIDTSAALETPGVLLVLTHENRPELPLLDARHKDQIAPGGVPFRPLWDDRICFSGQPVALVVAATLANAIWHATGKCIRDLPITLDKVFAEFQRLLP